MTEISKENASICFDLDGTLVDTADDLIAAMNYALKANRINEIETKLIRPLIGEGARAMIVEALRLNASDLEENEINKLWQIMVSFYAENIAVYSRPFEGALPAIEKLKNRGHTLSICTNKTKDLTQTLLDTLELTPYFDAITCGDSFEFKKPDPRHLFETIKLTKAETNNAIMIGDSNTDILTAKNANLPVIGVEWGYTRTPITELGADIIIESFAELEGAISKITANQN